MQVCEAILDPWPSRESKEKFSLEEMVAENFPGWMKHTILLLWETRGHQAGWINRNPPFCPS